MSSSTRCALLSIVTLGFLTPAASPAIPVSVSSSNLASCDALSVPGSVHELGPAGAGPPPAGFPSEERISSDSETTSFVGCASTDDDQVANIEIAITNLSGVAWAGLWYVADPETVFSNADGLVNGQLAFRIDAVGANTPLRLETLTADGIFEDGETWYFAVDDFFNSRGLSAAAFLSVGLVGSDSGGSGDDSAASIIAVPVPEPGTAALLGVGMVLLASRRRGVRR